MQLQLSEVRRTAVAAAIGTILVTSVPNMAFAHDAVIGGDPANGAIVQSVPPVLTLEFSGEPQEGFNTFALSRVEDGEILYTAEPDLDGRFVSLTLPEDVQQEVDRVPGQYRIGFQIVSSDGHATKGMTKFTYAPDGMSDIDKAEQAIGAQGEATSTDNRMLMIVLAVAALMLIALIGIVVLAKRKK